MTLARLATLVGAMVGMALSACATSERSPTASAPPTETPPASTSAPTATSEAAATLAPQPSPRPSPSPYGTAPEIISYSVAGRPLTMYRFGGGPNPRLIVAGIHGGYEWNTIALAHQLMSYLSVNPWVVPPDTSLYILPALNPDGEARSHGWEGRANENGVDLNRNWPSRWQENWPKAGCWGYLPIHGGGAPASEPEVAGLMDFILEREIEALISYHSAALGIFPGGQPPLPASVSLAETVAEAAPYAYPPVNTGCLYTGQFADWAAEQGIPALDVELMNHSQTDLDINIEVLHAFLNWNPPAVSIEDSAGLIN